MDFSQVLSQILPYLPYVFTGLFILVMLGSVLFALVRGMSKARIRFIILAVCLLLAFVTTWAFKNSANTVYPQVEETIEQALTSDEAVEVYKLISGSEPMQETLIGFATALVAPLFFFVIFVALRIVTWIIYFIVMLFIGGKMKKDDAGKPLHGLRALLLGVLQGALIFFVLMTPIYTYLTVAAPAMEVAATQTEAATNEDASEPEQSEGVAVIQQSQTGVLALGKVQFNLNEQVDVSTIKQMLDSVQNNFFFSMYGKLGGNLTCNFLTEFTSGGEKTNLVNEVKAIGTLATEGMKLKDISVENLDEETAAVIGNLMTKLGDSKMVQTIVGEAIYAITDAWKNDRAILGLEKPELDPMVAPIFDAVLNDFHSDARETAKLDADFKTLGEMVTILAKSDVLKNVAGENSDPDKLIESLAGGTVIKDLITALGSNETLKNLIPEVANVGMRAIGASVLNLPENADEIYDRYIDDITAAINEVLAADMTDEEKVDALAAKMLKALDDSGLEIQLDESVAKLYADALLTDIRDAGLTEITSDDVRDFFEIYAGMSEEEKQQAQEGNAPLAATVRFADEKKYKGSLYGNKTKEELQNSAVGKLSDITKEIAKASEEAADEDAFRTQLEQIKEQYGISVDMSGLKKDAFTQEALQTVSNIKEGTFPTVLVTMEDLLIDTSKVNETLNKDTIGDEAEKINKIFTAAMKVKDAFTESGDGFNLDKLNDIATDLGDILNSLDSTATFGDKTSAMITAVFQKEEVAESMNMDVRTATELAKAATEKVDGVSADYSATMESVSTGAAIANKLNDETATITEEDIESLLRSMTPQTANMLKVYLTEERVKSLGVADKAANAAARLLKALFEEMADKQKYPDYSGETAAMLKMFDVARAAVKGSNGNTDSLFNHDDVEGLLKLTAAETVELVMDSNMVRNAVVKAMYAGDEIDPDMINPFGLNIPTGEADYVRCEAAIEDYYGEHPESKTFLKAIAALFGVEAAFLND